MLVAIWICPAGDSWPADEPLAAFDGAHTTGAQMLGALVEQHRMDSLDPGGVFAAQVVIQLQQRPILQHLRRRDVALRQPLLAQQAADQPRVRPVGLGPSLATTRGRGFGRIGQMRDHPGTLQLLDHITPTRARLRRERDIIAAVEPMQPSGQLSTISREDLPALHLPAHGVEIVESDLLPVHIEPAYDRHQGLLKLQHTACRTQPMPSIVLRLSWGGPLTPGPGACHLSTR